MKDNKLIAEFMGAEHVKMFRGALSQHTFDGVQYHTSWDWLMPVVEKCLIGEAEQDETISKTTSAFYWWS